MLDTYVAERHRRADASTGARTDKVLLRAREDRQLPRGSRLKHAFGLLPGLDRRTELLDLPHAFPIGTLLLARRRAGSALLRATSTVAATSLLAHGGAGFVRGAPRRAR